jgi:hypothetical protein
LSNRCFKADTRDDAPEMLVRGDVSSRISPNNYIELETLAAPANVQQFVQEMLAHLVSQEEAEKRIHAGAGHQPMPQFEFIKVSGSGRA